MSNNHESNTAILWRPPEPFRSESISGVLGVRDIGINHPIFGKGFAWQWVPERGPFLRLEFFQKPTLMRLGIADVPGDYQHRDYGVDEITALEADGTKGIAFHSTRPLRTSVVTILTSGIIQERQMWGSSSGMIDATGNILSIDTVGDPSNKSFEDATAFFLTPEEAAKRLGITANAVRKAIREGSLPKMKLGGRQYILSERDVERYSAHPRKHPTDN